MDLIPTAILPLELVQHIISIFHANSLGSPCQLVPCCSIDRLFNQVACQLLYKRIHLLPHHTDLDNLPLFQSLANNPRLGTFVQSFKCWDQDADPDWLDEQPDEQVHEIVLSAFKIMTGLVHLALTPCRLGEFFITTSHNIQWQSLRELHIFAVSPLKYMWNPVQVSASGSLSNLSILRWTMEPVELQESPVSPFFELDARSMLTLATAFLVSVVELCCPLLSTLEISCSKVRTYDRGYQSKWKVILDEWMINQGPDFASVLSRMAEATEGQVPCKLTNLENLSITTFHWSNSTDYAHHLLWLVSFFRPQLSSITSLRLNVEHLGGPVDQQRIKDFCSAIGRNLQSLSLECEGDMGSEIVPWYPGIFASIKSGFDVSLKDSLRHLAINRPGPFNRALAQSLKEIRGLRSLSLDDHLENIQDQVIDGGWLDWDKYHEFLYKFVQLLPKGLENLAIISHPDALLEEEDHVAMNAPGFCHLLPNLQRFHLSLEIRDTDGCSRYYPKREIYFRRLPSAGDTKRIAVTYFVNNSCPEYWRDARHRGISRREFVSVVGDGLEHVSFEGRADEDGLCAGETLTQEDIDMIRRCGCGSFAYANPCEGVEVESEVECEDMYSDLEID